MKVPLLDLQASDRRAHPGRLKVSLITLCMILVAYATASAKTNFPVLVSDTNSTRAIALESVTFTREPFAPTSPYAWGQDQNTRVMIFALNLTLQPGEDFSALTADAEDVAHRHYNLKVEYFGSVPSQEWLSTVILRLSDDLTDVGDVLVRLTYNGAASNRVRLGIGHVGGGLPDDNGATPTPAPPYTIRGQVTEAGKGLGGVLVRLSGTQNDQATTDNNGSYAFTVTKIGDYTVTPSKTFYDFAPESLAFTNLSNSQTGVSCKATRKTFTIGGQVTDVNGKGVDGILVTLSDVTKGTTTSVGTSNGGNFSFANVAAGFNYTVTATSNIFEFASQSIDRLGGNLTLSFKGARLTYNIIGRVTDAANQGIAGATIGLGAAQTATTDSGGNYSLTGVVAGFDYTITPSTTHYIFNPLNQTINNLDGPQTINFNGALRKYIIAGRITDGNGNGLIGMTVTLTGFKVATTVTDSNGNYSFSATALGSYSVTPSVEQAYYAFAPASRQLNSLSGDQTVSFTGTLSPITNPFKVIEFDGSPRSVDYGYFWPPYVNLGHFFWEFWAMPGDNAGATYLLSDGYGGAHSLLFGFGFYNDSEPGRYQLFGDTFDGVVDISHITFFSSDQGPAVGEWGHLAVGWDGHNIITYYDGVPVGKTAFTGPRQSPGFDAGGGKLLIGGSDHSNLIGRIAQVRGYEGSNPREDAAGSGGRGVEASFVPQTVFGVGGNLLSYYFHQSQWVADLSNGYAGQTHVGVPRGTTAGVLYDCGNCPPPQFVVDPTAPNFPTGTPSSPVNVGSPLPVPNGARIFDSFGRVNSTYLFGGKGGLGLTEGGTAGQQLWQTGQDSLQRKPFGILNGIAVLLGNDTSLAWVPTGSATGNLDVRINRRPGTWGSGISTGVSFRVAGDQNYFFAYTSGNSSDTQTLTLGYYQNGQRTNLATAVSMPASWTTLSVVTKNTGSINVYADGSLVYSTNSTVMASTSGVGLYNNAPGLALVNRWDNFTVYDAP